MIEKETGSASPTSNTYVSVSDADAYLLLHMSGATWAGKSTQEKEAILVTAGRIIDYGATYKGYKKERLQGMQWPRYQVEMQNPYPWLYYDDTIIPPEIQRAQMEVAALLLVGGDRTADQDADGIASVSLGKGAVAVTFDPHTAKTLMGRIAPAMLADFAISISSKRGMAQARRG